MLVMVANMVASKEAKADDNTAGAVDGNLVDVVDNAVAGM